MQLKIPMSNHNTLLGGSRHQLAVSPVLEFAGEFAADAAKTDEAADEPRWVRALREGGAVGPGTGSRRSPRDDDLVHRGRGIRRLVSTAMAALSSSRELIAAFDRRGASGTRRSWGLGTTPPQSLSSFAPRQHPGNPDLLRGQHAQIALASAPHLLARRVEFSFAADSAHGRAPSRSNASSASRSWGRAATRLRLRRRVDPYASRVRASSNKSGLSLCNSRACSNSDSFGRVRTGHRGRPVCARQRPGLALFDGPTQVVPGGRRGRWRVTIAQLRLGKFGPRRKIDVEKIDVAQRRVQLAVPPTAAVGIAEGEIQVA